MNSRLLQLVALFWITIALFSISGCGEDSQVGYTEETPARYTTDEMRVKALQYQANNDYSNSAKWYLKVAEKGDAFAQWVLGTYYLDGLGVKQDYVIAKKWFRKAAEQGNIASQWQLGKMYRDGSGVSQDYQKALRWFRKASEQGDSNAQYELGMMYQEGVGVEQDYTKAMELFYLAAEEDNEAAKEMIKANWAEGRGGKIFGVAGVRLGMTVSQAERRLGKFSLVETEKAAMKELTGGLLNLTQEGVDKSYIAVTTESPGFLNRPGVNLKTGALHMGKPKFEKDGFKFWELKFTRKELGPKLLSMDVSREFDTKPDWDLIQEKLVEKYGIPSHTDAAPSSSFSKVKKRYLWGECENSPKYLNVSHCEGAALLVSFEEGTKDFLGTYNAKVEMEFVDGRLEKENEAAIQKAKQAKVTKTASQVDNLNF